MVKKIVIAINFVMLILAGFWYKESHGFDSLIAGLGQVCTIFLLFFEKTISKNILKNNKKSIIKINNKKEAYNNIKDSDDCDIDIQN